MQEIRAKMNPTNSISNSIADTLEFNVNETPHIQTAILIPSISGSNSYVDMSESNENPANTYLSKVNSKNTRKGCEICSKLTIKTPE